MLPKNLEFDKTGKTWNFEQKSIKYLEFWTIFTCLVETFLFDTKNLPYKLIFFFIIYYCLIKNTFEVALHHPFNFFILFKTVFYLKLNFKLKIDPEIFTFKNLEKINLKHLATLLITAIGNVRPTKVKCVTRKLL